MLPHVRDRQCTASGEHSSLVQVVLGQKQRSRLAAATARLCVACEVPPLVCDKLPSVRPHLLKVLQTVGDVWDSNCDSFRSLEACSGPSECGCSLSSKDAPTVLPFPCSCSLQFHMTPAYAYVLLSQVPGLIA